MSYSFKHRYAPDQDKFWVVTCVSNPVRYKSRYELYHRFKVAMEKSGANLFTVELAFGDRPFEITHHNNPHNLQVRNGSEIWVKENLLNLGVQRLPPDWKYVCFADADIEMMRQDWVEETIHQLQHYKIVQGFEQAIDLGPSGNVIKIHDGFVWSYLNGKPRPGPKKNGYPRNTYHSGYIWSFRREAFNDLGGLIDFSILGSADFQMANAYLGEVEKYTPSGISPGYLEDLLIWEDRATKHIRKNIGFVPGSIYHNFHGAKINRGYETRWGILTKHQFDPEFDLRKNWEGVFELTDTGERMRDDLRAYFRKRNEDGLEV